VGGFSSVSTSKALMIGGGRTYAKVLGRALQLLSCSMASVDRPSTTLLTAQGMRRAQDIVA
jgi:hypothetical protein